MPWDLETIFHPRSVAIVGVSPPHLTERGFGTASVGFLLGLLEMGFPTVYPVNPKYEEVAGLKCYPSLLDIEGPVDHVISSVPASVVPQLVEQAIAKGVRSIHFFTAGFSETGDVERAALEEAIVKKAREAGIRVIGPNCMGLYVPKARLSFSPLFPKEPGPVALVSQSGGHAIDVVIGASQRGVRFSKVVSYGNATDINESELLEHLASDEETEVICAYIEGVRDGRRFLSALKGASAAKPVIVLKGGRTSIGGRATLSHTASMAGSMAVFDAALKQAGAIRVDSLDELADLAVGFTFLGVPRGPRVAVVGGGGGMSVLAADLIGEAGLDLPELPTSTQEELRAFTPLAGTSVRNPVDTVTLWEPQLMENTLRIIASAENVDAVILHMGFGFMAQRLQDGPPSPEETAKAIAKARQATGKPIAVAIRVRFSAEDTTTSMRMAEECWRQGLPVFFGLPNAVTTLAKMVAWRTRREEA